MGSVHLQASRYTHVFHYPDGLVLAYNTLTGSLLPLPGNTGARIARALESATTGTLRSPGEPLGDLPERDSLLEMGFLVDGDIDELMVVKEIWRKGRRKKGDALLTILPTLSCNFSCPYCFERHIKGSMTEVVQDALITFTKVRLLPRSKELSLEWFGGEPLVGISVIDSLTTRFRSLCAENGLPAPTASITTNGYLLCPEMCARLLSLGVSTAQVTLDGPPDIHDRRRPLAGGLPSFDRILRNIKEAPDGFSIAVRVNVDAGNKDHVFTLIELLHAQGIIPRMAVYVAKVESFSEECRSSDGMFLSSAEYASFKNDLHARCRSAGIPWSSDDTPRLVAYGYCVVDQPKGFVVQPDGELLKCWAEAGNRTGRPVAHLLNASSWGRLALSPLQSRDPFDDDECCGCSMLPACMGGCPRIRETLRHQGVKRCPPLRYALREEVLALYLRQQDEASEPSPARRLQTI